MVVSALGTWKISQNYLQNWLVVCGFRYVFTSLVQEDADLQPEKLGYKRRKQIKRMRAGFQSFGLWTAQFFKSLGCQQVDIPAPMWSWARFVKWNL